MTKSLRYFSKFVFMQCFFNNFPGLFNIVFELCKDIYIIHSFSFKEGHLES